MRSSHRISCLGLLLTCACGAGSDPPVESSAGTQHVEERTIDGDVTTVRTVSGSKWSDLRLVEELSIGVDEGPEELMLGAVGSVWVDGDRIAYVDYRLELIRLFDREGRYLSDVSRRGQGPGEFDNGPSSVMLGNDGRIVVTLFNKIHFFSRDAEFERTWPWVTEGGELIVRGLIFTTDNDIWAWGLEVAERRTLPEWDLGPYKALRIDDGGFTDEELRFPTNAKETERILFSPSGGSEIRGPTVPFAPIVVRGMTARRTILQGFSDRFRFEMLREDGSTLVAERHWTPVDTDSAEADHARQATVRALRRSDPEFVGPSVELPDHRRAYFQFVGGRQGRIWVLSRGPGVRSPDCVEPKDDPDFRSPPCYSHEIRASIFDERDGTFYGEVRLPEGLQYSPLFIDGDLVAGGHEDAFGVQRIKLYRLEYDE